MRSGALIVIVSCLMLGCATGGAKSQAFQLYLVRHAEKQADAGNDPHLTGNGHQRARHLAEWLQDKSITDIWSSDYFRTRETAQPLADAIAKQLNIYDPRKLQPLANKLLEAKHNALVVGHSNTTPDLARILCQCEIEDMDESEHDRLIVVTVDAGDVTVKTLKQGSPPQD